MHSTLYVEYIHHLYFTSLFIILNLGSLDREKPLYEARDNTLLLLFKQPHIILSISVLPQYVLGVYRI